MFGPFFVNGLPLTISKEGPATLVGQQHRMIHCPHRITDSSHGIKSLSWSDKPSVVLVNYTTIRLKPLLVTFESVTQLNTKIKLKQF